ncbi:MAG TPA: hypothetical protein V6D23_15415 [Candidatus Obscuribacterales bacterium]
MAALTPVNVGGIGPGGNYFHAKDKQAAYDIAAEIPGHVVVPVKDNNGQVAGYSVWQDNDAAQKLPPEQAEARSFCREHEEDIQDTLETFYYPGLKQLYEGYEKSRDAGRYSEAASQLKLIRTQIELSDKTDALKLQTLGPSPDADTGLKVYFFYGFDGFTTSGHTEKTVMTGNARKLEQAQIDTLRQRGYTVVIDETATIEEMQQAIYDPKTAGLVLHSHGSAVGEFTGYKQYGRLAPDQIDPRRVSPNLRMIYSLGCKTGQAEALWEQRLNGAQFYGIKSNVIYPQDVRTLTGQPGVSWSTFETDGSAVEIPLLPAAIDRHMPAPKPLPRPALEVYPFYDQQLRSEFAQGAGM